MPLIALVAAITAAAPAPAAPASTASKPAAAISAVAAADKPVCRYEMETDSHFSTRVCHTKAQWNEIEEEAHREVQDSQRSYGPH